MDLTPERVEACRECVLYSEEELEKAAAAGRWNYLGNTLLHFFPVRSVGVHGDVRVHGETVVVRAVQVLDGMSARYSQFLMIVLTEISTEITNKLKGQVNRVVYDITHKPPGTIEWE